MEIKMSFAGDLMCKLPQLKLSKKNNGYDFGVVFSHVEDLLKNSDYVVGNMETPIAGSELGYTKAASNFNTPVEFAKAAKEAGFDFFAIANNHCLDRGIQGLFNTIDNLKEINIDFTGGYKDKIESEIPFVTTIKGLRVAVLAYTYGTNSEWLNNVLNEEHKDCVDLFRQQDAFKNVNNGKMSSIINPLKSMAKRILPQSVREKIKPIVIEDCVKETDLLPCDEYYDKKLREKIKIAQENSDVVIMYMHSGGQFNSTVGEYTKVLAHRLVDYGCDFVIGSHPHCVLNYEIYNGKFIAYSLGNFCFTPNYGYQYKGVYSDYSIMVNLYFDVEKKTLSRKTINVLKVVNETDGNSVVYPVFQLLEKLSNKQKQLIINDVTAVLGRFFGLDFKCDPIQMEIPIDSGC